jgi:hypothetical protein
MSGQLYTPTTLPWERVVCTHWIGGWTWLDAVKKNSMIWVRERTIPTERPPLVGEVIANFCGKRVPRGQRDGSLQLYSRISRQEQLLFYQVAPQLYSDEVEWIPFQTHYFFFSGREEKILECNGTRTPTLDRPVSKHSLSRLRYRALPVSAIFREKILCACRNPNPIL